MSKLSLDYHFIPSIATENNIIVLIHGYGSSKDDLVQLCPLFQSLKNTSFYVVNAPFMCDSGIGYQWFSLDFNGNDITIPNIKEVFLAGEYITNFIAEIMLKHNLSSDKIALFGFSQGGILALISAIYGKNNYGAIVCHSGLLINNDGQAINNQQNILLIHGKVDEIVAFEQSQLSEKFLKQNHFNYQTYYKDTLGHSVDEDTIAASLNFFRERLR